MVRNAARDIGRKANLEIVLEGEGELDRNVLDRITAPIPGLLVNVNVRPGDTVAEGDTLVVMESMKLLMDLKAAATGTVATVGAVPGTTVEAGALLVQLDLTES